MRIERVSGTTAVDLDDDMPLPVAASPLTTALLAKLLAEHTYTYKLATIKDKNGRPEQVERETMPPPGVLAAATAGKEWPQSSLAGIIGTPVLRRDWSLLQAPGYDPASGLYLAPTVALPVVPETPHSGRLPPPRHSCRARC